MVTGQKLCANQARSAPISSGGHVQQTRMTFASSCKHCSLLKLCKWVQNEHSPSTKCHKSTINWPVG